MSLLPIPSWDELFIRQAYIIASKSKDESSQIGSVLVRDRVCLGSGFNGFPKRVNDFVAARYKRPHKLYFTEHSERNAIYQCARLGIATSKATLFTLGCPCDSCARAIIQSEIREVVLHREWEDAAGKEFKERWGDGQEATRQMFAEADINVRYFSGKIGAKVLINGKVHEL